MPITDFHVKNLISHLRKAPVAFLVDQEPETLFDERGKEEKYEFQKWAWIKFKYPNNALQELHQKFEDEVINNRYQTGFEISLYSKEPIKELIELNKKFLTLNINKSNIRIRNDFKIKYLSSTEEVEKRDSQGSIINILPKILVIPQDQFTEIKNNILKEISDYFKYQEEFINNLLSDLKSESKVDSKREYGTTYKYNYFMFNYSQLGPEDECSENILDFFKELIEKSFVSPDSLKALDKYFNNTSFSSKIKWLKSKEKLSYLISQLIENEYIISPKRKRIEIICKIFCKKDGSAFLPKQFDGVKPPSNTSDLDIILGILG